MKTYEILSKTREGKLVAVVSTEAVNKQDALKQTANFCYMLDIEVHSVRVIRKWLITRYQARVSQKTN